MDQRTGEHLDIAARNQKLVRDLLALAAPGALQPPPYEWIAVIAFYSALHYVDAYLWEILQRETRSHPRRAAWVRQDRGLNPCTGEYHRLWNAGGSARYDRGFSVPASEADELVNVDLATVERVVRAAL
ncbi:MAG: hypothetical protein U0893_20290 [Chloroflexota bacterium]